MKQNFSLKEEIRVILEEMRINLNVEDVFDDIQDDELMLDAITAAIYEGIKRLLAEKNITNEALEERIYGANTFIITSLKNKGII